MKLWAGIAALLATGLWMALGREWSPLFRAGLVAHVVIGLLVVPTVLRGLYRRLSGSLPKLRPPAAIATLVLVTVSFILPYLRIPIGLPPQASAVIWGVLLVCGVVVWSGLKGWFAELEWSRARVLEVLHALLWALCAATGPLIVALGGGRRLTLLFGVHSAGGLTMVVLGTLALLRVLFGRWRAAGSRPGPMAAAVLGSAAVAGGIVWWRIAPPASVALHLSAIPWSIRDPSERDALPLPVDPAMLSIASSCGDGSGCHAEVLADHRRSPHDRSMRTRHMERSLELLDSEAGPGNRTTCAGCHQPRLLAETRGEAARSQEGLSCVVCHAARAVELAGDPRKSTIALALDSRALSGFAAAEGKSGSLDRWTRLFVNLNPGAHGRSFKPALLGRDELCLACHRLQIEPSKHGPRCLTCHMPPRDALALGPESGDGASASAPPALASPEDPPWARDPRDPGADRAAPEGGATQPRSHFFPGTDAMLPTLLGDRGAAHLVRAWASSDLLMEDFPATEYAAIPSDAPPMGEERLAGFRYLDLRAVPGAPPRRGEPWRLRLVTTSRFIDHAFPAGPMDLLEMWLEVEVRDESGRLVFESGALGADHRVEPGAHRMGGYAVDANGAHVEHYQVWNTAREVVERHLVAGESTDDVFDVPIPADAGSLLTVRARWLYRELAQDYVEWAYGAGAAPVPSIELARAFAQARVESP